MIIDNKCLDNLTLLAKENPRLRQGIDMRTTPSDNSQRLINAMEPGTIMPIHRHKNTTETMLMVRGKILERLYDETGCLSEEFVMEPCGSYPMIKIPAGQWHS